MTNLPEDPNRWPSDPFKLLGVERTTDTKTARRAYFNLVRKFKPDQNPVEFQKVREAFEQVEQWLTWNNIPPRSDDEGDIDRWREDGTESPDKFVFPPPGDDPAIERGADDAADDPNTDFNQDRSGETAQRELDSGVGNTSAGAFSFADQVDSFEMFQQSLKQGDIAAAVATINEMGTSSGPSQAARANLSKYFLSRFVPDAWESLNLSTDSNDNTASTLDLKRIAWLLSAIRSTDWYHSAIDRLRDEFDRNYRLANCEPVNDFLADFDDFAKLAEFYRLRWEAIGHSDWRIVVADVESLKPRSLEFNDLSSGWVDLLAASMEYTVWQTEPICAAYNRECWREISESRRSWTADAVELMVLAAEEWRQVRDFFQWSSALPWARNTLPGTVRRIWQPVAQSIASDRSRSLRVLNQFYRSHSIAMSYFEDGLKQLASLKSEVDSGENWDETRDLVACFFSTESRSDYAASRRQVLDFCVINQIEPMSFAHAANTFLHSESAVNWTELVQNDGPLACIYDACKSVGF